jgi:hypothetical protein
MGVGPGLCRILDMDFRELISLLKNSLGARVQPTLGTKYAGFEAF